MTAMVLVLAMSGCGSDGKGGSTPVPVTTGSTPAPTPSPAPSPSPTPVARTYDVAPDFTHDRSFTGYDRANITFENRKVRTVALSSSDTGVTTFTQQGGKITLPDSADLPNNGTYALTGANISSGRSITFSTSGGTVNIGLPPALSAYSYFVTAEFYNDTVQRSFLIGAPTDPAELIGLKTLNYSAMVNEESNDKGKVAPETLVVDLVSGTVTGTISALNDAGEVFAKYKINGKVDSNGRFSGTFSSSLGDGNGEMRGRMYGKGGKEIAILMKRDLGDGRSDIDLLTGRLQ